MFSKRLFVFQFCVGGKSPSNTNSHADSVVTVLTKSLSIIPVFLAAMVAANVTSVNAQDGGIEEVIVEAQASSGDDPLDDLVSVSVLDAEKLADAGIENVEDVAAYVPALTLTQTATGTQVCIRGICQGLNQGIDPSVGMYVDKVPYPRPNMSRAPFLDLANVQVLRGPQNVTDGHYSIAGSIHLLSNLSVDEFKAGADFTYIPSQNDSKLLLTVGGPINDQWAANFVVQRQLSDGYVENVARNDSGPSKDDLLSRLVIGFNPTEDLSFKLKVESGSFDISGRQNEIFIAEETPFPSTAGEVNYLRTLTGGDLLRVREISEQRYLDELANDPSSVITLLPDGTRTNLSGNFIALTREPTRTVGGRIAWPFEAPEDFIFRPKGIGYDLAECNYTQDPDGFDSNGDQIFTGNCDSPLDNRQFYYAGRSYQGKIAELYQENGYELPVGLLDSELNFSRAADAPEISENDSFNITLNTDLYLGESLLTFTASYIDYDQVDLIDGDELPVNMLVFNQQENYSQTFFRLDFKSPQDRFLTFDTGISYMRSDLAFEDQLAFGLENIGEQDTNPRLDSYTPATFDPNLPLRAYLGGTRGGNAAVAQLQRVSVERQFNQDTKIGAAFFSGTLNWREDFRTTLGLRYTNSEKSAVRDQTVIDPETGDVALDFIRNNASQFSELASPLLTFFNIQIHTDRFLALADDMPNRVDELTLAPAFGDTSVEGGTSRCLDLVTDVNGVIVDTTNGTGTEALCFDNSYRSARAIRGTRREEVLLPSIALEWNATEDLTLIGSVRTGNKLGGFDARSSTRPDLPATGFGRPGTFEFEDETAVTYELMARWFFPFIEGELNATLYKTDYTDLQLTRQNGSTGQNVDNAGAASTLGVEVDGYITLTDRLDMNYSLSWTDFEYDEYFEGPCQLDERPDYFLVVSENEQLNVTARDFGLQNRQQIPIHYENRPDRLFDITSKFGGSQLTSDGGNIRNIGLATQAELDEYDEASGGLSRIYYNDFYSFNSYDGNPFQQPAFCNRSGSTAQYVAKWQGTFSFNHTQEIAQRGLLKTTLDVLYNSGYFTDSTLDPDLAQGEYVQLNGRIEVSDFDDVWVVALTAENLTNQKIVTYAREIFGSRSQGAKVASGFVRSPRALGLNVRYNFY